MTTTMNQRTSRFDCRRQRSVTASDNIRSFPEERIRLAPHPAGPSPQRPAAHQPGPGTATHRKNYGKIFVKPRIPPTNITHMITDDNDAKKFTNYSPTRRQGRRARDTHICYRNITNKDRKHGLAKVRKTTSCDHVTSLDSVPTNN